MDFNDTPDEAKFRAEVKSWLAANAQHYLKPWAKEVGLDEFIRQARDWQRRKAEAGYAAISWPKEI
ncbi:MAG TPA: acyl-CoA dehydrogenase, partial [Pseudomonadales bacterium]|nr:acyl-CoA dehydrogenase [Pseudomonadales bacterium]